MGLGRIDNHFYYKLLMGTGVLISLRAEMQSMVAGNSKYMDLCKQISIQGYVGSLGACVHGQEEIKLPEDWGLGAPPFKTC